MWRQNPTITVTGPEGDTEELSNVIRTSQGMMVPELRASVRDQVSNLRPPGLPPPGKTTQGFRGSQRSSSRESAKPKSFRTVRNFWRRMEGAPDNPPPRRFLPLKKSLRTSESGKSKTSGFKMPMLRKVSNARESARRSTMKKSSARLSSTGKSKRSVTIDEGRGTARTSTIRDEEIGPSIKSSKASNLKSFTSRQGSEKRSSTKAPSRLQDFFQRSRASIEKLRGTTASSRMSDALQRSRMSSGRTTMPKTSSRTSDALLRSRMSSGRTTMSKTSSRMSDALLRSRMSSGRTTMQKASSRMTDIPRESASIERPSGEQFSRFESSVSMKSKEPSSILMAPPLDFDPREGYKVSTTSKTSERSTTSKISKRSTSPKMTEITTTSQVSKRSTSPKISKVSTTTKISKQSTIPDLSGTSHISKRSTIPELSTTSHISKRSTIPELSTTSQISKRSTIPELSTTSHISKRSTIPELSTTSQISKRSTIPELSTTAHISKRSTIPKISELSTTSHISKRSTAPKISELSTTSKKSSRQPTSTMKSMLSFGSRKSRMTKASNLEQIEEEGTDEMDEMDEGKEEDKGEEEEDEGEKMDEEDEEEKTDEEDEGDLGDEEAIEEEEMEEEEEVEGEVPEEVQGSLKMSKDAAVSPPSSVMRPSSLWGTLPRMFSEESIRPSVILPVLLEEEKLFHELVAGGDVSAVEDFISKRPNFNINCENYQGISPLHIAVKDDNEDMVQYLLSLPGIEVRDCHLFAVRDNHPGILVMILDKLKSINPALEFMACTNSPEFAENITPLILAAEAGHFEIIGLLIDRGHKIPRPHKPRCFCKEECQAIMKTQDVVSISSGKLHIYRAYSNPAFICQTETDPLLVAFQLSKELMTCGLVDTIYYRQYEALADSLRAFAVELIAECRTLEEVEIILAESKSSNLQGQFTYPRLVLALDYKQKEFIAHPNVQQVLERAWIGDWIAWRSYKVYVKALYVIPRLFTLPWVLIVLMFSPTSKTAKHFSLPVNKFLSNIASYIIFLLLVFVQSNVDKTNQTRENKPTGVEIFLVIYVLTFTYNTVRAILKQGVHRFFKFMWNIYELIMETFFLIAIVSMITAEINTTIRGNKDEERKYWNYLDPQLIAESFFVLAAIMAFMKILLIFQISFHLGPLQVSLGKMTNDCAMFSLIFAIIILAFTAGLCKFYNYYADMVQTNLDTGEVESTQVDSFTSVLDTFKTLFWGLFGMSSFDVADVIIENIEDPSTNITTTNEHHLTEAVGYFAFATYMILTVIVILNMLIATMSNTFQKVTDNVDTEYLFGRTEVYMSYIDVPVLPPPFNVIPTTHALVNLVKGHKAKSSKLIGVDVEKGIIEDKENKNSEDYYVLMSQLVQRYFSTKNSEND